MMTWCDDTVTPINPAGSVRCISRMLQALNVVLTHAMADFDTLAAAVGLAKLWKDERPDDGENIPRNFSITHCD